MIKIFSIQMFDLGIKKPRCFYTGGFFKMIKQININNASRANGIAIKPPCKSNAKEAKSFSFGRANYRKIWREQNRPCLPDHLPVAQPGVPQRSAYAGKNISVDEVAEKQSMQMPFQELHRGIAKAIFWTKNDCRTI